MPNLIYISYHMQNLKHIKLYAKRHEQIQSISNTNLFLWLQNSVKDLWTSFIFVLFHSNIL